ncbi:MAG: T9SS type A sorting domain-containing protein [Bacteroidota bacterium]
MNNKYYSARYLLLFVLVGISTIFIEVRAQVATYGFSQVAGTYTPITGGTVYLTATSDDQRAVDPATPAGGTVTTGVGLPIGFDFIYNGFTADRLAINNNGWISLGHSSLTPAVNNASSSSYTALSATSTATPATLRNRIGAVARDLQAQVGAEVRLETIGIAPNRVCIIQWTGYKRFGTNGTGDNLNFQIRLYETSNVVEAVYGAWTFGTTVTTGAVGAQVGLGGSVNTDYNNRTSISDWNTAIAGTVNNATIAMGGTNIVPVNGTVFRWAVPPPTPSTPTEVAGTPTCSSGTFLTVSGTPPTDVIWYWQEMNANGTSTLLPASSDYNATTNGTYYLRAMNTVSNTWSVASSSFTVTSIPVAVLPPAAIAGASPACLSTSLTAGTPPANTTFYWQTTLNGVDNTNDAVNPLTITATGNYYLAAYNSATQCWSNTVTTNVVINTVIPAAPTVTTPIVVCTGAASIPLNAIAGTVNWFDAPTAGTQLGTGSPFEAIGTSVMPTSATPGTYSFYAEAAQGACNSTTRTLLEVELVNVDMTLIPIHETCTGYSNGSFAAGTVNCGLAPFTYSVDGGAFGSIPTNLTAGTYTVIVKDGNNDESVPYTVVINTTSTVIPNDPTVPVSNINVCAGVVSIPLAANTSTTVIDTLQTLLGGTNGCGGGVMFNLQGNTGNVTITGFDIIPNVSGAQTVNVYTKSGTYLGSETTPGNWTLLGAYPITGTTDVLMYLNVADFIIPSAAQTGVYLEFNNAYTTIAAGTTYSNGDLTVTIGAGLCASFATINAGRAFNGRIYYESTATSAATWFDAPTGGVNQGTGNPLEAVGTAVLPTTSVAGTYEFYVAAQDGGCFSLNRELVTVFVSNVNQEFTVIDASCNNGDNGSFTPNAFPCGSAPFSYSVDGGAFGPIPTNLSPGTYQVQIQDGTLALSGFYDITIGSAQGPDGIIFNTILNDQADISWNAYGTETSWNIEWGASGFIPGTGAEIGSGTASDTTFLLTGLDGNTSYDVFVSANCGGATTPGDWTMASFTTLCDIQDLTFFESFEATSATLACWENVNEVGTGNWTLATGSSGGLITTAYQGTQNARFVSLSGVATPVTKFTSPLINVAGQDSVALTFALGQEVWAGDQNITKVYVRNANGGTWTQLEEYNSSLAAWTLDTLMIQGYGDTIQLAFEGTNNFGRANVVDAVKIEPCTLTAGTDGESDICRLDGSIDLNTLIVSSYTDGSWSFPANPGIVNGSMFNVSTLASGSYDVFYIKKTTCAADTTIATINVYNESSAGDDGTMNVCRNEPVSLLEGLAGNIDLGGEWYDPSMNPSVSAITANNIPGQYNYTYITGNGVCPDDTSSILLNVSSTCNYLNVEEMVFAEMTVYPNPSNGIFNIANESSQTFSYEVMDVEGRLVERKEAAVNATSVTAIDMTDKVTGIYMIRVYNAEADKIFRVVLQ